MKASRGISKDQRAEVHFRLGPGNWILIGVFVMVLAQMLMTLPIGKGLGHARAGSSREQAAPNQENRSMKPVKPWGNLEIEKVVLEVPDEYISDKLLSAEERSWFLPTPSFQSFLSKLNSFDLTIEQRACLQNTNKWRSSATGFHFSPEPTLTLGLSARGRQQVYSLLAAYPQNVYQFNPFSFHVDSLEERFAESGLPEATLAMAKSLLYQRGQSYCFSDLTAFDDLPVSDRRRLLKTLTRVPVVFMRLRLTPDSDVGQLVNYWGKQGNVNHVKPLLERLVKNPYGTSVDVTHLLPSFARKRIYTFPFPSPTGEWEKQDCFWTAMNFFADQPDDRVPNLDYTFAAIKKDFFEVQGDPTFGDMVTLVAANGKVKHVCIYVADDVVFTKNGGHFLQPWALMKIPDMIAKYPADPPLQTILFRSKKS